MNGTILLADDDSAIRKVLSRALNGVGCKVHATSLLSTLTRWTTEGRGDLVITDVAMPDGNGIEQIQELHKIRPDLPIIVISAQNTIMTAIQAQEAEAFSYLPKPFDLPELLGKVREALLHRRQKSSPLTVSVDEDLPLVGRAPVMQAMYKALAKILKSELPLHLCGETGTGKSLVAQIVHECGNRKERSMVVVGAHQLEDSETAQNLFAKVGSGTIILDEVGDLSVSAQQILARQLDTSAKEARVISCSHRDLSADMAEGDFRKDLYFRLCGTVIEVPALRRRQDDIPLLVDVFLRQNVDESERVLRFAQGEPPHAVSAYRWPGNVRELQYAVIKASLSVSNDEITWNDIAASLHLGRASLLSDPEPAISAFRNRVRRDVEEYIADCSPDLPSPGLYLRMIREVEVPLISAILQATGGSRAKCAEILGINRNTLRKKIRDLDINDKKT